MAGGWARSRYITRSAMNGKRGIGMVAAAEGRTNERADGWMDCVSWVSAIAASALLLSRFFPYHYV